MKFAKIRFETRAERVKAVEGLLHRAKVIALRGGIFIVPDLALEWLNAEKIAYTLLEKVNQDDAIQTLRNAVAHSV